MGRCLRFFDKPRLGKVLREEKKGAVVLRLCVVLEFDWESRPMEFHPGLGFPGELSALAFYLLFPRSPSSS